MCGIRSAMQFAGVYSYQDEELLYNSISSYLQTDHLYALPAGQRTLITMVLRKLLASSSFAIAGTLNSLIDRLQGLLDGIQRQLDLDDYDTFTELHDDEDDTSDLQRWMKRNFVVIRTGFRVN